MQDETRSSDHLCSPREHAACLLVRCSSRFPLLSLYSEKAPSPDNSPIPGQQRKGSRAARPFKPSHSQPIFRPYSGPRKKQKDKTKKKSLAKVKSQVGRRDAWGSSSKVARRGFHDIRPPVALRKATPSSDQAKSKVSMASGQSGPPLSLYLHPLPSPSTLCCFSQDPLSSPPVVTYLPRPGRRAWPLSGGHRPS